MPTKNSTIKKASQQFQMLEAQTSNLRLKLTGSLAEISRIFSKVTSFLNGVGVGVREFDESLI